MSDRYIPDSECKQGKCARPTTGCWGECGLNADYTACTITFDTGRIAELEQRNAELKRLLLEVRRHLRPNEPKRGRLIIANMVAEKMCEWCAHVDAVLAQAAKK